jgi:phage terminase small subunit
MIRGDQPSRINRTPPLPLTEPPRCPDWLTADGDRADFDRVAEQLYRAGIAKLIDSDAIAMYVRTAAVWRQADALVGPAGGADP